MKKSKLKKFKVELIILVMAVLVGVAWLIKSSLVSPQVALVAEQPSSCISNVVSFTAANDCGEGKVRRVDYVCAAADKKGYEGGGASDCIDIQVAYEHAQSYCGQTCSGSVTETAIPRPSTTPQPSVMSSSIPSPMASANPSLFSCKVKVFKLKDTDPNTTNPTAYATPDREVVPGSNRVSPGENYAYLIEGVSNSLTATIATISASTSNISGFDEPILVKSTTPYCKAEGSVAKYLSCTHPSIGMIANTPALLKLGMVVEIQKGITSTRNTSTNFHVNYLYNGIYYPADCALTMLVADTAATPVPTIAPGCYEEQQFCLKALIGGACSSRLVCPSPTPYPSVTPTPTPVVTSTATPTQSPQIPVVSCAKQLGSWTYRESCSKNPVSYRYLDYKCQGEQYTRTMGGSTSCKTEATWIANAKADCLSTKCVTPTPTPYATVRPTPTPAYQRCYRIFGRNYCWTYRR